MRFRGKYTLLGGIIAVFGPALVWWIVKDRVSFVDPPHAAVSFLILASFSFVVGLSSLMATRTGVFSVIVSFLFCAEILWLRHPMDPQFKMLEELWLVSFLMSSFGICAFAGAMRSYSEVRKNSVLRRDLLDSIPALVFFKDDQNRILRCNKAAAASKGLTVEEMEGRLTEELYPEEAKTYLEDDREVIYSGKAKVGILEKYLAKDGDKIWIQTDKFPHNDSISGRSGVLIFAFDVTQRIKAEERQRFLLQVSKELSQSLNYRQTLKKICDLAVTELADVCIADVLNESSKLERVVVSARDPKDYPFAEEVRTLPIDEFKEGGVAKVFQTKAPYVYVRTEDLEDSTKWDSPFLNVQSTSTQKTLRNGKIFSFLCIPMVSRSKVYGVLTFCSTATTRRKYTQDDVDLTMEVGSRAALAIENAHLYQHSRNEVELRQSLLASVSHELKNPLSAILLNTQLIEKIQRNQDTHVALPEKHQEAMGIGIGMIESSAQRMSRLVNDLLDLSKMEGGNFSLRMDECPLGPLLMEVSRTADLFTRAKHQKWQVELRIEQDRVECDRERLIQVFMNLVSNATKFTPEGGVIKLEAVEKNNEYEFHVVDQGPGVPETQIQKIFERYWQEKKTEHLGTGLGLSIAKGIVEAHRGKIWVQNLASGGCQFSFTLPKRVVQSTVSS